MAAGKKKQDLSIVDRIRNAVESRYYGYELQTSVYMMYPKEKLVLNAIVLTVIALVTYGIYFYFPPHVRVVSQKAADFWNNRGYEF